MCGEGPSGPFVDWCSKKAEAMPSKILPGGRAVEAVPGEPLKLGEKLSFYTADSSYHGGTGGGDARREFACGQYFDGRWENDEQEGHGSLKTKDGNSYEGEWSGGNMHGQGTYTWSSGSSYSGQWEGGIKHGEGTLTLYSGNVYTGQWRNGKRHGWGTLTVAKPTIGSVARYEGEWVDDARTGKGTTINYDGHVELSRYENGQRVGEGLRVLDPARKKPFDETFPGPFRLMDGKEVEMVDLPTAEGIAKSLGLAMPEVAYAVDEEADAKKKKK